jgi:hypothetical protein
MPKAVRIKTAEPVQVSQLAANTLMSRAACRVQGRTALASVADTDSATSSKRGGAKTVEELVKTNVVPSRIPNWDSVFNGSSAISPGRES